MIWDIKEAHFWKQNFKKLKEEIAKTHLLLRQETAHKQKPGACAMLVKAQEQSLWYH